MTALTNTISYYEELQDKAYNKIGFFETLMDMLPGDVVFQSMSFSANRNVSIKATAFLQESVHALFEDLNQTFKNVDIDNLKITKKSDGLQTNTFGLSFDWELPKPSAQEPGESN